jgi:hypothetical protein
LCLLQDKLEVLWTVRRLLALLLLLTNNLLHNKHLLLMQQIKMMNVAPPTFSTGTQILLISQWLQIGNACYLTGRHPFSCIIDNNVGDNAGQIV